MKYKVGHPGDCDVKPKGWKTCTKHGHTGIQWKNLIVLGNCLAFHMNLFKNFHICNDDQKLQTGDANHNIWRNYTKSVCLQRRVEHLPRPAGCQILLSLFLYFSGFLILGITRTLLQIFVMKSNSEYGLVTMLNNCKNWNWPEFIAGRAEDSFTCSPVCCDRYLCFVYIQVSHSGKMSLVQARQTAVLYPLSL